MRRHLVGLRAESHGSQSERRDDGSAVSEGAIVHRGVLIHGTDRSGDQQQECCGLYPSTQQTLSTDTNVSCSPRSRATGTSEKTSATSSALDRDMTVSAAPMMKRSKPVVSSSRALSTASAPSRPV